MRDVNYPAQKSYLLALTGIIYNSTNVPVYYGTMPDNISADNYIVYGGITNTDGSTKSSAETFSLMRVTIHTIQQKYNTGKAAGDIAGQVFQRLYPNSQAIIDLTPDGLQCISTDLVQDLTQDYNQLNARIYLDRIIIFRHKVLCN